MSDKDIIQVLQYIVENGSGACDKCPVFPCGKIKDYEDNQCGRFIAEKALDLISRQQAEIERFEKLQEEAEKIEYMHNFQGEPSDIVKYIYQTHDIIKQLKTMHRAGENND